MTIKGTTYTGTVGQPLTIDNHGGSPFEGSVGSGVTFTDEWAADGTTAVVATSSQPSGVYDVNANQVFAKVKFRTPAANFTGDTTVGPILYSAPAQKAAQIVIKSTGKITVQVLDQANVLTDRWGTLTGTAARSTQTIPLGGQEVRLELGGTAAVSGTLICRMFLGDSTTPIDECTINTDVGGTPHTFTSVRVQASNTYIMDTFRIRYGADFSTAAWPEGNDAPTVVMPGPVTATAGQTVQLTATADDGDGTITGRLWAFDYPTTGAPSLTGSTLATTTFTAGAAGSRYTLRHTATDNTGASTSGTVDVYVPQPGDVRPLNSNGIGPWENVGGAATIGAAIADESGTTFVRSPTLTSSVTTQRIPLQPSTAKTAVSITLRGAKFNSTAPTILRARLYEGGSAIGSGALRKTWSSITITGTATDRTLTLTDTEAATIVDWKNLALEIDAAA